MRRVDIHVGDVLELKKEHPCGSRFPGITGESEAMLRLKASILKAAAHGREKRTASELGISLATLYRRMGSWASRRESTRDD